MTKPSALMALACLAFMCGCTAAVSPDDVDDEDTGENESSVVTINALGGNALGGNALGGNALGGNALAGNALGGNSLNAAALAAIQDPSSAGDLARSYVRYLVTCSFTDSQSFTFSWTDSSGVVHAENYVGHLGIAPEWATGPLDLDGQHMVTGCMGALVNYYGVHVTISVRSGESPLRLRRNDPELNDYSHIEGAFWGNLWAPQPYVNTCYNAQNVANSRAHQRDCAAGHLNPDGTTAECGIIDIVGSCASVCKKYNASRGYYEDCREKPGSNKRTDLVITTALP